MVIPVVKGALKTMSKKIHHYIKQIEIPADTVSIQKTAILGRAYLHPMNSARHLRNYVDFRCLV